MTNELNLKTCDEKNITVILTVWKRNHLRRQLQTILQQTLSPAYIWVQQTQKHVDVDDVVNEFQNSIKYSFYPENKGIFGRFESVGEVQTSYVFIMDDDIIPGTEFLENAMRVSLKKNAIVSPAGRIIPPGSLHNGSNESREYMRKYFIGDGLLYPYNYCYHDTCVSFGNNAWLLRTEWMKYFFSFEPYTRDSGEDIHLSATCKILGGIDTFVPEQTTVENCGNLKRSYSFDEIALHRQVGFCSLRSEIVLFFKQHGWLSTEI